MALRLAEDARQAFFTWASLSDKQQFETLRGRAREAARAGDFPAALALFSQARDLEPGDAQTRVDVADQLQALGDVDAATDALAELVQAVPAALEWLKTLGRIALAGKDPELSAACWRLIFRFQPWDRWAGHNLGLSLLRCDRVAQARAAFEAIVTAFPDFAPAWRGLGQAESAAGRHEQALACFAASLEREPEHLGGVLDSLSACVKLKRLDAARDYAACADRIAPQDPRLAALAAELAVLEREAEAPARAEDAEALISDAKAAADRGDRVEAFAALERAATLRPDDLWIRNDLGHLAVDLGRLDVAEAQFAAVLAQTPRFFHSLRGQARIAQARGAKEQALGLYAVALEIEPGDCWVRWEIASLQAALGRPAEAAAAFRAILAENSGFAAAWSGLARTLEAQGDADGAFAALCEGRQHQPDDPWLTLGYAKALAQQKRFAEAEALLATLAGGGPAAAAAALALYYLKRDLGEDVAAAACLAAGLSAAPDEPSLLIAEASRALDEQRLDDAAAIYARLERAGQVAYWRLIGQAALARQRREVARARRFYEEAIAVDPSAAPAYGGLCELAADPVEAARALEKLDAWIASRPDDAAPRLQKAAFLAEQGDHAAAFAECASVLECWPEEVGALIPAAKALERLGRLDDANALVESARRCAPDDPALLELLARRAEESDDLEESQRLLAQAITAAPSRRWFRIAALRLTALRGYGESALDELEALRRRCGPDPEFDCFEVETLTLRGRLEDASARLDEACARYPHHFRLLARRATLSADLGRFADAERALADAAPVTRQEKGVLSFLNGYVKMAQWRFEDARPWLEAATAANPDDGWVLNRLIHCELMLFAVEAAGRHLRTLAEVNFSLNRQRGKSVSFSQTHYGQIYDEFRLDAEAFASVRQARAEPDLTARLSLLRAAVRRFPDYTPAAMALLTTCRSAGLLSRPSASAPSPIPREIVQFWDAADLPRDLQDYGASWRRHNPDFVYTRFDAESARAFLSHCPTPDTLQAFLRAEQPAMQADIFRLAWLVEKGGVYADMDDLCRTGLALLFDGGASLVLYQEDLGTVGNNFIAARPGHSVLQRALADVTAAINQGAGDLLWLSTGPGALTRALAAYIVADEAQWRERLADIRILDRHEMLAGISIHCLCGYKSTERHWSRTAFRPSRKRPAPR